jgi:molybdenum cofactor guanylyltransferase
MSGGHPVGVVLTGGASVRMGVDKATLVVGGKPMAVRVADALWEAGCHPVECQGGDLDAMRAFGLDGFADSEPGRGPLVAVHEALSRHAHVDVVTAACDLVDLDGASVKALIAAGASDVTVDVAVAVTGAERHLVCWWRAGTVDLVGRCIADGVVSYRDALSRLRTVDVAVATSSVRNVNTPSDLADDR